MSGDTLWPRSQTVYDYDLQLFCWGCKATSVGRNGAAGNAWQNHSRCAVTPTVMFQDTMCRPSVSRLPSYATQRCLQELAFM